jgi:uncharacterized protein (TIGR02996 family)
MASESSFLAAILADPDDDAVRLIYADWLDEHGETERAEFIRLQFALAGPDIAERGPLFERERQLLARFRRAWSQPLDRLALDWFFERGFIESARVEVRAFLSGAGELFQAAPLRRLELTWSPDFPELPERLRLVSYLAVCPHLSRLSTLNLGRCWLGSDGVQALTRDGHLGQLTSLNLSGNGIGDGGARALASSELLPRLRALDLSYNQIGPAGLRHLASALETWTLREGPPALRTLDLRGNDLGLASLRVVRSSPALHRAARLD